MSMYHSFQDIVFLEVYRPSPFQIDQLTWRENEKREECMQRVREKPRLGPSSQQGKVKMNPEELEEMGR